MQQHRFTKLEKNCIMIMSGATREYIEKNYELYEEIPIVGTTGYVYKTK